MINNRNSNTIIANTIILLVSTFFIISVSAKKNRPQVSNLSQIDLKISYQDFAEKKYDFNEVADKTIIRIPYISGSFFGNPEQESLFLIKPNQHHQLTLDLDSVKKKVKKIAKPLTNEFKELGLSTSPKKTKLARLGSFAYNLETSQILGAGASFRDSVTNDLLILVYVDREVKIKGLLEFGLEKYKHNIYLPKKGFYWLVSREIQADSYLIEPFI